MTEDHEDTAAEPKRRGLSLGVLFLLTLAAALALTIVMQGRQVESLEQALARYEPEATPTTLEPGQFRVLMRKVLDLKEVKLYEYRVETLQSHYARVAESPGSYSASTGSADDTGLYVTKITVLADDLKDRLKMMCKVGGASGYTIYNDPPEGGLVENFEPLDAAGVYDQGERVILYRWQGKDSVLTVK